MRKIFKEKLDIGINVLTMPITTILLNIQIQNGDICLWFECYPEAHHEERIIHVYGTGEEIHESNIKYISTVQQGNYVWHIYEQLTK